MGDGRTALARARLRMAARERGARHPALEVLLGRPARVDEVPALTSGGTQQLEALEPGHLLDLADPGTEPLLELGSHPFWHLDGVDLHDGHVGQRHAPVASESMRAATMRNWTLDVRDIADPVPGSGQVLVRTLACGICGSDLHMLKHGAAMQALGEELSKDAPPEPIVQVRMDPSLDVVMGHEFCGEVVELGPDCSNVKSGDVVVSMPIAFDSAGLHAVGYSNVFPGGYGELIVLNDLVAIKVPNGIDHRHAALTEPLAVGIHAVAKSNIVEGDAAVVLGCGPVGLAVIDELARRGIEPIVASDFSPTRRALAAQMGAHEVVDPAVERPMDAWRRVDGARPLVIFEAVGVPGMIDQAMVMAPRNARILVVGVCMQEDRIRPMAGIGRELNIQFVLGYDPTEFAGALDALVEGTTRYPGIVTGSVDVDGVPKAFTDLGNPEAHAKILVEP